MHSLQPCIARCADGRRAPPGSVGGARDVGETSRAFVRLCTKRAQLHQLGARHWRSSACPPVCPHVVASHLHPSPAGRAFSHASGGRGGGRSPWSSGAGAWRRCMAFESHGLRAMNSYAYRSGKRGHPRCKNPCSEIWRPIPSGNGMQTHMSTSWRALAPCAARKVCRTALKWHSRLQGGWGYWLV